MSGTIGSGSSASASASSAASASSGSGSAAQAAVGTWEIDSLESGDLGDTVSSDDLELLRDLGMNIELVMNSDGTMSFDMFGESMEGTWSANGTTVTIVMYGEEATATIDGDLLVMQDGADKLTFHRVS